MLFRYEFCYVFRFGRRTLTKEAVNIIASWISTDKSMHVRDDLFISNKNDMAYLPSIYVYNLIDLICSL